MNTTDGISRVTLTHAVDTRLTGITYLSAVYPGEVPDKPTIAGGNDPDPDGRVAPYAVVYPSPGARSTDARDAADTDRSLDWLVQVTVAAGYRDDLLAALDDVTAALDGWAPVIDGISCNALRAPAGYDPGPVRRDDDVDPPRFYVPLQYRLTATT